MKKTMIALLLCLPLTAQAGVLDPIRNKEVRPVNNATYAKNCADCHYAYPAGLLPERSWEKLMQPESLANHFGDNAEVSEADRNTILSYLTRNAADHSLAKRARKFNRSIPENATPLRISETAYFKHAHEDVTARFVKENPKVRSFSNCNACHTQSAQGIFDDDTVRIPGHGWWVNID